MTTPQQVRQSLVMSQRWEALVKDLPVLAMAKHSTMRPEDWTEEERHQAVAWSIGESEDPPTVISEWITSVLKDDKESGAKSL